MKCYLSNASCNKQVHQDESQQLMITDHSSCTRLLNFCMKMAVKYEIISLCSDVCSIRINQQTGVSRFFQPVMQNRQELAWFLAQLERSVFSFHFVSIIPPFSISLKDGNSCVCSNFVVWLTLWHKVVLYHCPVNI